LPCREQLRVTATRPSARICVSSPTSTAAPFSRPQRPRHARAVAAGTRGS